MPEINDLFDMEFEDPELEPTILPVDARLSLRGRVEEFRALFDRLTAVAPQKEKIPGTSNVHIVADGENVRLTASDGSQTLVIETSSIRINREGRALLPAHKLKQIFALAPEEWLTLTVLANEATITSGRAVWNITIPSGSNSHAIPDVTDIVLHEVPRRAFYKALVAVKRGLPGIGSRKSLEQAHIAAGSVTTSDGYRLLRQKIEGFPIDLNFSIPKDTIEELLRSLSSGAEETIQVGASSDLIVVSYAGQLLVSRQLVLDFPDIESLLIVPALENQEALIFDTSELRDLVKRIRVSADPEYASLTLKVQKTKTGGWELLVVTRDRSGNSAHESMYVMWEGEADPPELTLNHKFLLDLLESYSGSLATVRLSRGTKTRQAPVLLKDDERGFVGVVQQSLAR